MAAWIGRALVGVAPQNVHIGHMLSSIWHMLGLAEQLTGISVHLAGPPVIVQIVWGHLHSTCTALEELIASDLAKALFLCQCPTLQYCTAEWRQLSCHSGIAIPILSECLIRWEKVKRFKVHVHQRDPAWQ
jgi:hypothetical protein